MGGKESVPFEMNTVTHNITTDRVTTADKKTSLAMIRIGREKQSRACERGHRLVEQTPAALAD